MVNQVKWNWILMASLMAIASSGMAQSPRQKHVNVPIVPALPQDVSSPETIVKAAFDCESGPVGTPRQWARERTLFDPATISVAAGPEHGTDSLKPRRHTTFQQYVDQNADYFMQNGVVDRPLGCVTQRRAYVATVMCGYEYSEKGKVQERGVDIFQLYKDASRWWILSVVWDKESADNPIAPELLSQK